MRRIAAAALFMMSLTASADTALDASQSHIEAEFKQVGVAVSAPFTRYGGSVVFDAAKPASARAHIEITTSSFDIGDDAYNAEIQKKEWFNSAKYPMAIFEIAGLKPAGTGTFNAIGRLSLKGTVREVKLAIALKADSSNLIFDGVVPISRKDFDIGDAGWKDAVEDIVKIKFHIVVPAAR